MADLLPAPAISPSNFFFIFLVHMMFNCIMIGVLNSYGVFCYVFLMRCSWLISCLQLFIDWFLQDILAARCCGQLRDGLWRPLLSTDQGRPASAAAHRQWRLKEDEFQVLDHHWSRWWVVRGQLLYFLLKLLYFLPQYSFWCNVFCRSANSNWSNSGFGLVCRLVCIVGWYTPSIRTGEHEAVYRAEAPNWYVALVLE
jgi:hypothetical protein